MNLPTPAKISMQTQYKEATKVKDTPVHSLNKDYEPKASRACDELPGLCHIVKAWVQLRRGRRAPIP